MTQDAKKRLYSLLISLGVMIVASALVIVAFIVTYKFVTKPNDFDEIFGQGYKETQVLKDTTENVNYFKYEVKGDKANGVVLVGEKHHKFTAAGNAVDGWIGVKIALDAEGNILAVSFSKYGHSDGGWKTKVTDYLNSYVNTKLADVEATHTANVATISGASESGNIVYDILTVLKGVQK